MARRYASVVTRAQSGIDAPLITCEVHIAGGLPTLSIVGLAETAVKESRDRVRSAIAHSGFEVPAGKIVVNLAPADLPKSGGRYDLAIAVAILAASNGWSGKSLKAFEYLGELGLAGEIRAVPAVLPATIAANKAGRVPVVPSACAGEAALAGGQSVQASSLLDVVRHLLGDAPLPAVTIARPEADDSRPPFEGIIGQMAARRAMTIAATGGHNLLLCGPPGTGKSLLAQRLPRLLPRLTNSESLETASIRTVAGEDPVRSWGERPFRAPHHSASVAALVGGGAHPRPGEISLAHNGVLFLDELPEWGRHVLESLREPLESGVITIARAQSTVTYPARFRLVAAMNPCPCGYAGDPLRECRCAPPTIARYTGRISGPLIDRIDIGVSMTRPKADGLLTRASDSGSSDDFGPDRSREMLEMQLERQGCLNARVALDRLASRCERPAIRLVERAADALGLSLRRCTRILRVARTVADISACETISRDHVAEALSLRPDGIIRGP